MALKISKSFLVFLFLIVIILFSSSVLAEESYSSTPFSYPGIGLIIFIIMVYQISKSEKIAIEESNDKHIGVAGWLLFFIGIIAIGGLIIILRIISDILQILIYDPSLFLSFSFIFLEFLDLVSGVAAIFAAYYLWKVKFGARGVVIAFLVFDILVVGVNWLVSVDEIYLFFSFFTLSGDVIMLIYFLTSRRVKNTYKPHAKIPKKVVSSNKTVIGWIIFQAVIAILFFLSFQFVSWTEIAEYSNDLPCIEYCSQYAEVDTYYYGYDEEIKGMLCECQKGYNLISSTTFQDKPT